MKQHLFSTTLFILCVLGNPPALTSQNVFPPTASIEGFKHMLESDTTNELNVILIHGMGVHVDTLFDNFCNKIAGRMGFERLAEVNTKYPTDEWMSRLKYDDSKQANQLVGRATLRIIEFKKIYTLKDGTQKRKILRFHSFVWSNITRKAKDWLLELDKEKHRNKTNRKLKRKVVTEGLSDVALYQNEEYKFLIQLSMAFAMTHTEAFNPLCPRPEDLDFTRKRTGVKNVIITTSLGSKLLSDIMGDVEKFFKHKNFHPDSLGFIMCDTKQLFPHCRVDNMSCESYLAKYGNTYEDFQNKTKQIFMLSNQLPLLAMNEFAPNTPNDRDHLNRIVYKEKPAFLMKQDGSASDDNNSPPIKTIVFNEPNDILGFTLGKHRDDSVPSNYVLVKVKYGKKIFFGVLVDPETAHTGVTTIENGNRIIKKDGFPYFRKRYTKGKKTVKLLVDGYHFGENP